MFTLSDIPSAAWAALLTPFAMGLLFAASRRSPVVDHHGHRVLGRTFGLNPLGLGGLVLGVGGLVLEALGLAVTWGVIATDVSAWPLVLISAPIALLGFYCFYAVFIVRVRFSDDGIWYGNIRGENRIRWDEVIAIVDSVWLGTYLDTANGRLLVSKYRRGFPEFLIELRRRKIAGSSNESLSRA